MYWLWFPVLFAVLCLHLFPASVACLTDKNKLRTMELPLEQTDSASSMRGQTKRVCLAFLGCDAGRREWLDRISQKQAQGFCAADARAGGVLTRVELQLPWSGAGRVAGHGRNTGLGSACGRSGVLPAVDGRGLRSHCRIPAVLFQDQLLKV